MEAHFEEVRGQWEERFERRYGFWRGFVDEQVLRFLDCGLFENGFARIRCPECSDEYLLAFSCKTRELCPSCAAKRSAATAALLAEDVIEEVGHAQWVFVIPKMLRPYFLHHRELLGGLVRGAWETVLELMCAVVDDVAVRPGMVAVVQTAGDLANWQPHVHAIVSRGGWTRKGGRQIDHPDRQNLEVSRTGCLAPTLFAANKVACLASPPIAFLQPRLAGTRMCRGASGGRREPRTGKLGVLPLTRVLVRHVKRSATLARSGEAGRN